MPLGRCRRSARALGDTPGAKQAACIALRPGALDAAPRQPGLSEVDGCNQGYARTNDCCRAATSDVSGGAAAALAVGSKLPCKLDGTPPRSRSSATYRDSRGAPTSRSAVGIPESSVLRRASAFAADSPRVGKDADNATTEDVGGHGGGEKSHATAASSHSCAWQPHGVVVAANPGHPERGQASSRY